MISFPPLKLAFKQYFNQNSRAVKENRDDTGESDKDYIDDFTVLDKQPVMEIQSLDSLPHDPQHLPVVVEGLKDFIVSKDSSSE